MEDDDWDDELAKHHVPKRARHRKNTVVVFDDADRSEYISGFRKRKSKRRDAALHQQLAKERQKRRLDRRERREARKGKDADGGDDEDDGQNEDGAQDADEHTVNEVDRTVGGTATYEDTESTTVVRVTSLTGDEEDTDVKLPLPSRHAKSDRHGADRKDKARMLKVAKAKLKKKKQNNSGKRIKRDKSMSKHSKSRNRKVKKK